MSEFMNVKDVTDFVNKVPLKLTLRSFKYTGRGLSYSFVDDEGTPVYHNTFVKFNTYKIEVGDTIFINGVLMKESGFYSVKNIKLFDTSIMPVYGLTDGLTFESLQKIIKSCLELVEDISFNLPEAIIEYRKIPDKKMVLEQLHSPTCDIEQLTKYQNMLKYEELYQLKSTFEHLKYCNLGNRKYQLSTSNTKRVFENATKCFDYELTEGQVTSINDIIKDITKENDNKRLHRLLQGDVGSGKTTVAFITSLFYADCNLQTAILAPTDVLAKQHYIKYQNFIEKYNELNNTNYKVGLLVGGLKTKERREILKELEDGTINIIIGTHALYSDDVIYNKLAYVIIDEQHKYGVDQRRSLVNKGTNTDILSMSATPIPRSLTVTIYGYLDVSIIPGLPNNRQTIDTEVIDFDTSEYDSLLLRINDQITEGRQAFVVCPLISDSQAKIMKDIRSVDTVFEELSSKLDCRVAMLHGKLTQDEKDEIMNNFKNHEIDVLIATTVIEVGVDVPNSTIMIIENAERFGLAQLHQLRGRVGRGSNKSYCYLINGSQSENHRLNVMAESTDGFYIADQDLLYRGPGSIIGQDQKGLEMFKHFNPVTDERLNKFVMDDINMCIDNKLPYYTEDTIVNTENIFTG